MLGLEFMNQHYTYRPTLKFLLDIKVFVGVAVQTELATQISLIFFKVLQFLCGKFGNVVQGSVDYLLVVHRLKKLRFTVLR